jgi:hypothetical protein
MADYSPGHCLEGGTGVIVAKNEGERKVQRAQHNKPSHVVNELPFFAGLFTVKYIYGPATVSAAQEGVIGSSLHGRIENGITIERLITIVMPMKGATICSLEFIPVPSIVKMKFPFR